MNVWVIVMTVENLIPGSSFVIPTYLRCATDLPFNQYVQKFLLPVFLRFHVNVDVFENAVDYSVRLFNM